MSKELEVLQRRFDRERRARKEAESLLEKKSRDLFESNQTLSNLALSLEDSVNERTSELERAVERALQASKAKSEFLSNMSHELRTPLNAILGFSDILLTDPVEILSEEQKDSVQEIYSAGNHLLSLINEVLDLAKIEAGKLEVDCKDIDIAPIVMESIALIKPLAQKEGIEFELECDPEASFLVYSDAKRLKQVILNIMSNAIKYNKKEGYIRLLKGEVVSDKFLRFIVEDSGVGISETDMSGVFETFQRVGDKTSIVEGTGIGLPLSKKIMEQMGGDIDFSSEKGKGSKFWIDIPLAKGIKQGDLI